MWQNFIDLFDNRVLPLIPSRFQVHAALIFIFVMAWIAITGTVSFALFSWDPFTNWFGRGLGAAFLIWFLLIDKRP